MLRVFLSRGERGLNCFEAVDVARDYVLRTTVSELIRYHGIAFLKKQEGFKTHDGHRIECVRYSLSTEGAARARLLLGEDAPPPAPA